MCTLSALLSSRRETDVLNRRRVYVKRRTSEIGVCRHLSSWKWSRKKKTLEDLPRFCVSPFRRWDWRLPHTEDHVQDRKMSAQLKTKSRTGRQVLCGFTGLNVCLTNWAPRRNIHSSKASERINFHFNKRIDTSIKSGLSHLEYVQN